MRPVGDSTIPLPMATHRVATELSTLSSKMQKIETGLEAVISNASDALDGKAINLLQEVDIVLQSMSVLATYLHEVSKDTKVDGVVCIEPALKGVTLRDVANRLAGSAEVVDSSGHAELF